MRKLALLVAFGLFAVACGGSNNGSSTGPKHGGTLTVAIGIDPDTLDPAAQTTTTSSQVVDMMAETLVGLDKDGKVVPLLATSWTAASDGMSYTFTLRSGVKFSDGSDFNAQAVKTSLDRLNSPDTFKAQPGVLKAIGSGDAVDATHVKINMRSQLAAFIEAMT